MAFFATSHGKSPCDGIGGTVKRLVARASLQAATDGHILNASKMYDWSSRNIPGVKVFFCVYFQFCVNLSDLLSLA